ncbi:hypothetical protein KV092_004397 [Escherichia coli]|nr:hypothetical protein [Salmonella enterica subsp. enterica]EGB5721181.1 hypothetical protein [Salmonella enterica subsp. enterica serovar Abony]EHS2656070.1 hypothetical protein [Escherichia coli]HBQ5190592.1 hypothetical protein [Klebsiella pneumoniae]
MKQNSEELGLLLAMLNTGHGGALAGNPNEASMNTGRVQQLLNVIDVTADDWNIKEQVHEKAK